MSDRNLNHLYPPFRAKVEAVQEDLDAYAAKNMIGYRWVVVEGFRTAEYQRRLYQQGRVTKGPIVTYKDGYEDESNHQSSMAVDFVPFHGHEPDWTGKKVWWEYLGHCARKHGLKWGGDWKKFKDKPHVEWDTADEKTYRKAREWQMKQGLR